MKDQKVVHFSDDFTMSEISEAMGSQEDIIYYTRQITEKNEFHIINHSGEFIMTQFITELFKFYSADKNLSETVKNTKVKGNDKFAIVVGIDEQLIDKLKNDLNNLLKK